MDNRITLPTTEIDFNIVGLTGQDHDTYPGPGQSARYDWMRLYLIGLLAHQTSQCPPTNYRPGTIWFSNSYDALKDSFLFHKSTNYDNFDCLSLSEGIKVGDTYLSNYVDFTINVSCYFYEGIITTDNFNGSVVSIPVSMLVNYHHQEVFLFGNDGKLITDFVFDPATGTVDCSSLSLGDEFVLSFGF